MNKGISFLELGNYNNAIRELLEAEKYHSRNPKIQYYLGMAYHGKGMESEAIEKFKKAISLDKKYSEAHNYLGKLYMDNERWDEAIDQFEKALENYLYDTPSYALYNMGWAYYSKKDYNRALVQYREVIRSDPQTRLMPQIMKNIGLLYYDQNNLVEAAHHFEKSVEMDSSLFDAYFLLGQTYLKMNESGKARSAFQKVLDLAPESTFGRRARNYLQNIR
ncbi:MAG: tetratricopeptide repeat protein [Smithella sp.]|nr:tetratricopeptide repeat protein [Smithella sp.]